MGRAASSTDRDGVAPLGAVAPLARRDFLRRAVLIGGGALVAACSAPSPAAPTAGGGAQPTAGGGGAPAPTSAPAAVQSGPTRGGGLRVGILANPTSLDPSPSNGDLYTVHAIYDPLVTFDKQLNPQPALAESWETPDERTMVLHLRKGVKFHDGTNFDAEAVKVNIEHTKDPATRTLFTTDVEPIDTVEVVDASTVKLHLKSGAAPLLASFGLQPGHMISPAALKQYGPDAGRHPVGTGPFMFAEWVEQDHVTLKRNPNYWNPNAVYLDEVVQRIVPDTTVRLANLKAGELDYVVQISFKDVAGLRANKDLQLIRGWAGADRFILNNSKPPFNNKALRQALQLAYDRAGIHRSIFFETGVIGYGPVNPPDSWAFDAGWQPFNPAGDADAARAKLKEGGAPDGFAFSLKVSDPINLQLAQAYQAMYEPLGIKVTIDQVDSAKRVADQIALNYEASLSTWQMTADPSPALVTPYRTGGSGNYLKYSNPQLDDLLDKAVATYDRTQRRTLYRQIDQMLADDAPCIIPYHRARFDVALAKVQGLAPTPDPQLELRGVWLST